MDLDEDCVKAARAQGLPVEFASLANANLQLGVFDVVTMYDVLEHVVDLGDTLRRVRNLLRPNGLLVIEVPDVLRIGCKFSYALPPEHNWHFTVGSLGRLFECQGWQTAELAGTQNGLGHPIVLAIATPELRAARPGTPEPAEVQRVLDAIEQRRRNYAPRVVERIRDVLTVTFGPRAGMKAFGVITGVYCALKRACGLYREPRA